MYMTTEVMDLIASAPAEKAEFHSCAIKKVADVVSDFPALPERKCASPPTEDSECFEDSSSECCQSVAAPLPHYHDLVRAGGFRPKRRVAVECYAWLHCDDRSDNGWFYLFEGDLVELHDVEYCDDGSIWYQVVRPWKRNEDYVKGWVDSANLVSFRPKQTKKVNRWVAPGPSAAKAVASESRIPFVFQEVVLCLVDGVWKKASVVSTSPLRVQVLGQCDVFSVDIQNVKKCETKAMVTISQVGVRALANSKSPVINRLAKGTTVQVACIEGDFAKINSPMVGYVQFRDNNAMYMLEPSYQKPRKVLPTLILTNLPAASTEQDVYNCLAQTKSGYRLPHDLHKVQIDVKRTETSAKAKVSFSCHGYMGVFLNSSEDQGLFLGGNRLVARVHTPYLCFRSCPRNWSATRV